MNEMVYLRPLAPEDAIISFQWRNNPEVWKFTPFRPEQPATAETEMHWLDNVLQRGDQQRFAICLQASGRYIGNTQLLNIGEGKAEFHLFIGEPAYWGKGAGAMATSLLLRHAFYTLGLQSVTLEVDPANIAALRIYTRQGFMTKQHNGNYLLMELNKKNYETDHHAISENGMDSLSEKIREL